MAQSVHPVGTTVRVKDPDQYIKSKASQLRNRIGQVFNHQAFSGKPIVKFPAEGRRKELQEVFHDRDLEVVGGPASER